MTDSIARREALLALGAGAALIAAPGSAHATPATALAGVARGKHPAQPLPFDPKKLHGLSERLLVSHHDNNYAGAVKNLNKVEEELARTGKDTPGFLLGGLKERELTYANSMILHEHYFGNLGGTGKATGAIEKALAARSGGLGRWEESFRATAMSLAGGSGWVVLDFNFHSGDLRTYWAGNHTQSIAFGQPLLVLDMFEHAYHLDFGAAAAKYVDAFFANAQWDEVNRRYERALRAHRAMG